MKTDWLDVIREVTEDFLDDPMTRYMIMVTSVIALLYIMEAWFDGDQKNGIFLSLADREFIKGFVEWFGVIYGFVWSTIVVKVWEQFENINDTFDREVDAIQLLSEDFRLLDTEHKEFKIDTLTSLRDYAYSVLIFMNEKPKSAIKDDEGEKILSKIRGYYSRIFHPENGYPQESDVLLDEILAQLNTIVDNRGDRITLLNQKTFESLKFISIVTSIVWLAPFYFLYFPDDFGNQLPLGIFGWILVIAVTFVVIVIMSITDDLSAPFDGQWTVDIKSWEVLVSNLDSKISSLQEDKKSPEVEETTKRKTKGVLSIIIDIIATLWTLFGHCEKSPPCKKSH